MKKVLYINCCMRGESRTEKLCRAYLEEMRKEEDFELQEVKVPELDICPFDEEMLNQRNLDIESGKTDSDRYRLAYDFASADTIIMAAPYWDASFPSKLKVYIEHVCVNSITFAYTDDGGVAKKCRADQFVYITTVGGFVRENPSVQIYVEELCAMFGIGDVRFYCVQGLDVFPNKVDQILSETLKKMLVK